MLFIVSMHNLLSFVYIFCSKLILKFNELKLIYEDNDLLANYSASLKKYSWAGLVNSWVFINKARTIALCPIISSSWYELSSLCNCSNNY